MGVTEEIKSPCGYRGFGLIRLGYVPLWDITIAGILSGAMDITYPRIPVCITPVITVIYPYPFALRQLSQSYTRPIYPILPPV